MPETQAQIQTRYATEGLKVNQLYKDTLAERDKLERLYSNLKEIRAARVKVEQALEDQEMVVAETETGKHPSMSAAAMKEHLKAALHKDLVVRDLKTALQSWSQEYFVCESDIKFTETSIRIAVARLTELGGFLEYLAAIRKAEPTDPTDVWSTT